MGHMVEYPSNGGIAQGYFAASATGTGPAVLVIQEWWGLVPHIEEVVDRFAAEGFTALAPDLYHGTTTTEPDEAGKLMMALSVTQAAKDLSGAVAFLQGSDAVTSDGVGVIGFCMGGGLALVLACEEPEAVVACAPFYGLIPWPDAEPDWTKLGAKVRGHYAENDGMFNPEAVAGLQAKLDAAGKDAAFVIHPGTDHAFFNDTRPEVFDAAASASAWDATLDFFRSTIV